jgi:2-oxoisovalerate dehydrogenase E1 component
VEQLKQEISWKSIVIIVDECRRTGSLSEWLVTWMVENIHPLPQIHRITAEDSFIPLGNAWEYLLPSAESIVDCVLALWTKQLKGVI